MSPEVLRTALPTTRPWWFAGIIAAVSTPVALWASVAAVDVARGGSFVSDVAVRSLAVAMLYGVPISLVVMFVFGYPLAVLLKKLGKMSAANLSAGAVLIGAIVAIAADGFRISESFDIKLPMIGGFTGLFAAIVFCLVAGIPFRRMSP